MKWTFFTIGLFLSFLGTFAQVPQSFNYQAVARDNNGNILASKQVSIRISIIMGNISGSSAYTESHSVTTNQFGLIILEIGKGTSSDNFSSIDWAKGQYFLKIELDENGGNSYKDMGTTQLLSVPFALYAANAPSGFNLNYPDGFNSQINITQAINKSKSYTVPAGKNLYIQAAQRGLKIDSDTFNLEYPPLMIAGPNQTITGIEDVGFISGFQVDASVTAITIDLRKGNYTVPANKIFVLYAVSNTYNFLIDGVDINPNGRSNWEYPPLILTPGKVLSGKSIVNGYLK